MELRLKRGQNVSCGCKRYDKKPPKRDLIGKVFKYLTVVAYSDFLKGRHHWVCNCACGDTVIRSEKGLLNGDTISCGCHTGKKRVYPTKKPKQSKYDIFINNLLLRYRRDADKRGYIFDLSRDIFKKVIQEPCTYCGSEPVNGNKFKYSGLDRVDSSLGYVESNIVPCCKKCNKAKRNYSVKDFLSKVKHICRHLKIFQA